MSNPFYVYYANYLLTTGFSATNYDSGLIKIAAILKNQLHLASVEFKGYFDESDIGKNSIRFMSSRGNSMVIKLYEEDAAKCDALKIKNSSGTFTFFINKEVDNSSGEISFILKPLSSSSGSANTTFYFDEIGFAVNGYQAYTYQGNSFLDKTFDLGELEVNKSETANSTITYQEGSKINYTYTPLYYINGKQMKAIQRIVAMENDNSSTTTFKWTPKFTYKMEQGNLTTNQVQDFNFAKTDLVIWSGLQTREPNAVQILYDKDNQQLMVKNISTNETKIIKGINNLEDYEVYYLRKSAMFTLSKGISPSSDLISQEAGREATLNRLFNDINQIDLEIQQNNSLSKFKLNNTQFDNCLFLGDGNTIYHHYGESDQEKIIPVWTSATLNEFDTFYTAGRISYKQSINLAAQKYDNGSNQTLPTTGLVMTAINWLWETTAVDNSYHWSTTLANNQIKINLKVIIDNFIDVVKPNLNTPLTLLQDNYVLSPNNWESIVRLANINVFICLPSFISLPGNYFSLIQDTDLIEPNQVGNTSSPYKYSIASQVLERANKRQYYWNSFKYNSVAATFSNFFSNITFAATNAKNLDSLVNNHTTGVKVSNFALILHKK